MNENLPPITPPPEFPNLATVLQEMQRTIAAQVGLIQNMTAHAEETAATLGAIRAVVRALVVTHPDPQALQHHFEGWSQLLSGHIDPERVPLYSEALQPWSQLVREITSQS